MSQLWKMNDEKPVTIPLGKGNFNTHVNSNGGDGWFFNDWQLTRSDSAIPDKRYGFNIELWSDDKCLKKTELQYSDLAINSLCSNYQAEKLTVKETITCVGNGENRKITIKNISKHTVTTTLKSKFEPTLLPQSDSNNNPRFNDFFIRTKKIKNGLKFNRLHKNIALIHRLTKVNKNKSISWYNDLESKNILESTPYPVAVCEIDLSLEPGESTTLIFETKAKLINQTLGSKKGKFLKF